MPLALGSPCSPCAATRPPRPAPPAATPKVGTSFCINPLQTNELHAMLPLLWSRLSSKGVVIMLGTPLPRQPSRSFLISRPGTVVMTRSLYLCVCCTADKTLGRTRRNQCPALFPSRKRERYRMRVNENFFGPQSTFSLPTISITKRSL